MSWRDNLYTEGNGSFRGVGFYVSEAKSSIGRRTVSHEFPGQNKATTEDMGMRARKFSLVAYVLGSDYMVDRDKLRVAFEKEGPGILVHPYWGIMTVSVDGPITITETTAEGGMARFTLDVIETGEELREVTKPDTKVAVEEAADELEEDLGESFEDSWTVAGVIQAVRDAARDLINGVNSVTSKLNKVKGYVNAAMNIADEIGDAITDLSDMASAIILLPGQLVSSITNVVSSITSAIGSIGDAWDSYFTDAESPDSVAGTPVTSPTGATPASGDQRATVLLTTFQALAEFGSDLPAVTETTPQREHQAQNQSALITLFRGLAIAEVCRTAAGLPFTSSTKAYEVRDALLDQLDALIEEADDTTYGSLMDLRTALYKHLTEVAAALPRVIEYTPTKTLPALVIAQLLYGDATRETEILDRNDIHNPCLVRQGTPIQVLSNE